MANAGAGEAPNAAFVALVDDRATSSTAGLRPSGSHAASGLRHSTVQDAEVRTSNANATTQLLNYQLDRSGPDLVDDILEATDTDGSPRRGSLQEDEESAEEKAEDEEVPMTRWEEFLELAWTEGTIFQTFIMAIILANIFVLWGETDAEGFWAWVWIDNIFLLIFLAELVLRLMYKGIYVCTFGREKLWNYLDFTIVVLGMIDLWLGPLLVRLSGRLEPETAHPQQSGVALLRFLRMLRLLRLARVFNMVKWLKAFIEALGGMVAPVGFFLMLLFTATLVIAIILTQLFQAIEDDDQREKVQFFFPSVAASFFTLFQVTTTDNWILIANPVIELDPAWQIFFVVFIAFSAWTMISILTAVACDNMISAMEDKQKREMEEQEKKQKEFIVLLRKAFQDADDDGNGLLDREEFEAFLDSEGLQKVFEIVDMYVHKDEMRKKFEILDVSGSGELTIDEFVEGLATYQEGLSTKHIVTLDYALRRLGAHFDSVMSDMEKKVGTLKSRNSILLDSLRKQEQIHQQQHCAIYAWQQWALQTDPKAFPTEFLRDASTIPFGIPVINAAAPSSQRSPWANKMPEDAA